MFIDFCNIVLIIKFLISFPCSFLSSHLSLSPSLSPPISPPYPNSQPPYILTHQHSQSGEKPKTMDPDAGGWAEVVTGVCSCSLLTVPFSLREIGSRVTS